MLSLSVFVTVLPIWYLLRPNICMQTWSVSQMGGVVSLVPLPRKGKLCPLLRPSCLPRNSPARLDSSIVEDVLEREQECRSQNRLGDLGCNACKVLDCDEQVFVIFGNVPP